ncbi:hypothetical protein ACHAXS_005921 [Conticribra weissflogii]
MQNLSLRGHSMTPPCAMSESSSTKTSSAKLMHKFSGLSVWLEPDPTQTQLLTQEMKYLSEQCGGTEANMFEFVPHCTLLYNTCLPGLDDLRGVAEKVDDKSSGGTSFGASDRALQKQWGEKILRKCVREFSNQQQTRDLSTLDRFNYVSANGLDQKTPEEVAELGVRYNLKNLKLKPSSHYYFPYPKTADGGKGFGCCISLLILETTPELMTLHEVVKSIFPPDERHGGGNSDKSTEKSTMDQNGDMSGQEEKVEFRPHMALVYAPENHEQVVSGWLEEYTLRMQEEKRYFQWTSSDIHHEKSNNYHMQQNDASSVGDISWDAKYLSLWSTEGTLKDWYPVVKIDLRE